MKPYIIILAIAAYIMAVTSCTKDLDSKPIDPNVVTSANAFNDPAAYKQALAKVYAGLAVSGQQGPAGKPDISGIDEGFSTYLRQYWNAQELPTDEAVISWNDAGLKDFHNQNWSANNQFITAMYNRIFYQISLCNEYIRQVTPKVAGLDNNLRTEVTRYLAEVRFLRALSYYHALDLYGSVPFVTENDPVGSFFPKPISRADLFNYIETELNAIDADLADARTNEYGRADKACEWALLAKMYLNAEVYIQQQKYTECITNCNKIIAAGYSLHPVYAQLFMADNQLNNPEVIFPIEFDGTHTQSWGGMTYIISAAIGGNMVSANFGSSQKWGGTRTTKAIVQMFPDPTGATDKRAMFYTDGQSLEINDINTFTEGYAVAKFTNKTSTGGNGSNQTYVDTDFPMFRLADVYLMYAEAVLRGGTGGTQADALNYINLLRTRAYGNASGNITSADLTLRFILDERARELLWETTRRTDLVRYGLLTTADYLWPWKGGVKEGTATNPRYNIYPIPSNDIGANPNLADLNKQNGY